MYLGLKKSVPTDVLVIYFKFPRKLYKVTMQITFFGPFEYKSLIITLEEEKWKRL